MEDSPVIFVYRNREEFINRKNALFIELKHSIYFSDSMFKLMIYSGIKSCYKILNINTILKKHLNVLTNLTQQEWVEDVLWNIFRTIETSIDVLPLRILKKFENEDIEKYILDIIKNLLEGGDTEGFLTFIEEKNVYMDKDKDLVDILHEEELIIEDVDEIDEVNEVNEGVDEFGIELLLDSSVENVRK